jgi:hypothetical protein
MNHYADGQQPSAYGTMAIDVVYVEDVAPWRRYPSERSGLAVGIGSALGVGYADGFALGIAPLA